MNGGSRATSQPAVDEAESHAGQDAEQDRRTGGTSLRLFVMTIEPKAMTAPHERSMPAVRMMIVWPMAIVPITITCWTISEKLSPSRNRSVATVK